jgi:hypothetical protein
MRIVLRSGFVVLCLHACVLGTFFQAPSLLSRAGFAVPYSGLEANPYDTLGLKRGASVKDVKVAYHNLAKQWHPDKCMHVFSAEECKNSEKKMQQFALAFEQIKKSSHSIPSMSQLQELGEQWYWIGEQLVEHVGPGKEVLKKWIMDGMDDDEHDRRTRRTQKPKGRKQSRYNAEF